MEVPVTRRGWHFARVAGGTWWHFSRVRVYARARVDTNPEQVPPAALGGTWWHLLRIEPYARTRVDTKQSKCHKCHPEPSAVAR